MVRHIEKFFIGTEGQRLRTPTEIYRGGDRLVSWVKYRDAIESEVRNIGSLSVTADIKVARQIAGRQAFYSIVAVSISATECRLVTYTCSPSGLEATRVARRSTESVCDEVNQAGSLKWHSCCNAWRTASIRPDSHLSRPARTAWRSPR